MTGDAGVEKIFNFDYSYNSFDPSSEDFANQESVWNDIGVGVLENAYSGP
jgi:hypothetical protein